LTEMPIFKAKNQLASIIHEAEAGDSIRLTRHGKPAAMLLGMAEYERILGTGPNLVAALSHWRREWPEGGEPKHGSASPEDEVFEGLRPALSGRPVEL